MSLTDATVRLSQLSAAKRALLEKRLRSRLAGIADEQTIRRRDDSQSELPLSFAQQRLWFIDQLQPGSSAYNIPSALRLTGALKVDALERCINEIVRRHESLRTTFTLSRDRQPSQVIAPELKLSLRIEDLSELPEHEREAKALRLSNEEAQRPFDLMSGPLLRARLLRLSDEEHVLLFTMHHIISDGWSMGVLVREIGALYSAYAQDQKSPLPELPIQYADFSVWQHEWLQGPVLEEQLSYWREQLGGELPVLQLPTDKPRPPVQSYRGEQEQFALTEILSDKLKHFSRGEDATLFMTMLAAFQVLLQRYTGQEDILVGSPIANRSHAETEPLIGFFVNTLVLRTDLTGNPTFRELLRRVQKMALGAYAHQDLSFEKLVEELHPDRDMSRNPLVQVVLALQNAPMGELELHGLTVRPQELESDVIKFDLEFHIYELPSNICGLLAYNADLFERETIQRLLEHFKNLLEGIVANPDEHLSHLPLLSSDERRQLLFTWNQTHSDSPPYQTIHQFFAAQVRRTPHAIALECDGQTLRYEELESSANRLARRLRRLGVGAEERVGLLVERSLEQVVGLLGVLKAGGAYVPMEVGQAEERVRYMVEDAGVRVMVVRAGGQQWRGLLSDGIEVIELMSGEDDEKEESEEREGSNEGDGHEESEVSGENSAYVIYTSGSTGQPKGVVVQHRCIVNTILAPFSSAQEPVAASLHLLSYAFDGSMLSIFYPLCQGGKLVIPREGEQSDPLQLAGLIAEKSITYLCIVPTFYSLLLEIALPEQLQSLGVVHVAGEAVPPQLIERHHQLLPASRLFNIYGPTEITVWCTSHEFRARDAGDPVLIGRPSNNMQVYILDQYLQPVPLGVPGQVYIGGLGVSRGYLNQPALTAQRFIPHPFSSEAGARLYQTGDRARFHPEGEIEYLGRFDNQVKVRGYRIELGEIEAVLLEQESVREAAVVVREEGGEKRLIGYVVSVEGERASVGELREGLRRKLPEYMIPGVIVELERMPQTSSGKINRRALPAPEQGRETVAESFVAPRTPVEELLARIWGDVLKVENVGLNDDFFDLGGHSLLATQLISRVRESFAIDIPLRSLFESPTVAGLTRQVEAAMRAGVVGETVQPLVAIARDGHLPLSFAQQRLWFIHKLEPSSSAYNMPVAVRLKGKLDQTALEQTLGEIVNRHESLRTSFGMSDGQPVQLIAKPCEFSMPVLDLSRMPEVERMAEAHNLAATDASLSFDLERGPLYRASLLKLSDEDHVLLFTMHHIISDGWSMGVLVREVVELYSAFVKGKPSPLAPLPIQYADFAYWQRKYLAGEVLELHWQYWKQQLGGTLPILELPADRTRAAVQSFRGASSISKLPASMVESLKTLARREGVTLFMLLLAAFKTLLYRYTGQEDIIIGSPIANRNRIETEGLIGFFVNTLALRTSLSGSESFRDLLKRVRLVALEAYAHQDMPFEQLVEQLQPERSTSRHPLFQVMFQLGHAPVSEAPLPGLTLQSMEVERVTTQFDLSVDLLEDEDGLLTVAEYSTDLFDAETIARLLRHFQTVIENVLKNPDEHLARLSLLANEEREQLLVQWNETESKSLSDECLHELFEAQVRRSPEAIAVVGKEQQLTYLKLNGLANQLAHYLRGLGIGPEMRVCVLMESSLEMVAGLLAVLKAGAAYMPLDPRYPKERLAFIMEDAQASALITQKRFREALPEHEARVICVDGVDAQAIKQQSVLDAVSVTDSENLAYVIYTSGSTGKPKGVGVTHQCLHNHQAAVREAFDLRASDRVLHFASLSFDVAAEEIFPTLTSGGAIVLRDELSQSHGAGLLHHLLAERVSVLNLPASTWHEWARELSLEKASLPDSLRLLIVGSEAVSRESFAGWREIAPERTRWANAYGTTETTITATLYQPSKNVAESHGGPTLPIGRPLANTQVYILDQFSQPVPVGVTGELHIAGAGLARGYLNRPGLTAEKFIPHPFGAQPGARLYRTGDLARFLPDGNIEFIGRVDDQLKVRGFRIEPGEIEAVLREQEKVRQAAVLARQDAEGHQQLVAYVVAEQGQSITKNRLRERLRERLPAFMIPQAFVLLDELPQTASGKVDLRALPAPEQMLDEAEELVLPQSEVERAIALVWQEVLRREKVGVNENFFDLGGHSLLMVQVHNRLRKVLGAHLTMLDLFKYPTIGSLAEYVAPEQKHLSLRPRRLEVKARKAQVRPAGSEIAIIGMAGRFPGAKSIEQFWQNLREGVEAVSFFNDEELLKAGVDPAMLNHPNYVKAGVILDEIEQFDASFFGYSPREAEIMDPQHRLFLECSWEALERAGYDSETYSGAIGVFAGASASNYFYNLLSHPEITEAVGGLQLAIGNDKDHLTTHVSYKLNLHGPSVAVQTACSTSLVAVHMACRSLLDGECEMALAGGVAIHDTEKRGYVHQEGGITSPDGHCRAFDASAGGTISGSGLGVVVLKRLEDALADGDFIHAVIKGSAINNDGSQKVGYTAPSVEGQAEAIRAAQLNAGIEAESISYIEAHGTGTKLGDPIEIAALTQVFRESTGKKNFCAIGSLKTNLGHLDTAAGVAGLIKTVLALEHKAIPPSLHFVQPNAELDLDNSPFYVNKDLSAWQSAGGPRRAGVSSFGIGGTNAHLILEEAPAVGPPSDSRPWQMLMLSAKTSAALEQATVNLTAYLKQHPEANIADVAYTLQAGRKTFSHRRVVLCREVEDAISGLEMLQPARVYTSTAEAEGRDVVFMFPGQGSQYVNMGLELYGREPRFREVFDACCEMLKPHLGFDLREVLYPNEASAEDAAKRLRQTEVTQPALFVIEYALAKLWMEWGVRPRAMIGHSIGEYVAACLAGVFSLEDALSLVTLRGKLIQSLPEGAMLSVQLAEDELRGMLCEKLSLAAINGPTLCTVSGAPEAIAGFEKRLAERGIEYQRLMTSHAFHSQMMTPIIAEFNEHVRRVRLNAPKIRYVSNVSGTWIKPGEATDPAYWARHLRQTVRFADGARELLKDQNSTFLEVGPGRGLSTMVRRLARETAPSLINSLRHPHEQFSDEEFLMKALGKLWLAGTQIDWQGFYTDETRRRLPLPTYPFERRRYWVEWQKPAGVQAALDDALSRKPDVADWFYLPFWKPSVLPVVNAADEAATEQTSLWLVFEDERGFGSQVAKHLIERGGEVLTVRSGERFEKFNNQDFRINPAQPEDYEALILDLKSQGKLPLAAVHCWSITAEGQDQPGALDAERTLHAGFYSMVFLARSLSQHYLSEKIKIAVLTDNMQRVTGQERTVPEKATILGPCKVIPQEYPNLSCRSIDVSLAGKNSGQQKRLVEQVVHELVSDAGEQVVAYRAHQRLVQAFEPVRLEAVPRVPGRLREEGVYLITGGMGGIGLSLAEYLAQKLRARMVLIGRSEFPAKDEWPGWLETHPDDDEVSVKIRRLLAMENLGAQVLNISADVSDEIQMREAVRLTRERFGQINGVLHSAGISPGGMIEGKTALMMESVLAAKVRGTRVLEALLKDEELDFMVLFSSLDSILGAFGQVDYCAANAFLDAFAHYHLQENGVPTLTINWDAWDDTGMSANARGHFRLKAGASQASEGDEKISSGGEQGQDFLQTAISSREGIDAFQRLLSHDIMPQALVSTKDLPSVMKWTQTLTQSRIIDEIEQFQQSRASHPRPLMETAYVAPRNRLEEQIAVAWQSVLGIEQVGMHDNFFDLGGHSLLATQLGSRLRELCHIEIALRIIFERPTVAGLAEYVEQAGKSAAMLAVPRLEVVPVPRQARSVKRPRKTETK